MFVLLLVTFYWLQQTSPGPNAIKNLLSYSAITLHFVLLEIKAKNNFTLYFMLYKKFVHMRIFILLSFRVKKSHFPEQFYYAICLIALGVANYTKLLSPHLVL